MRGTYPGTVNLMALVATRHREGRPHEGLCPSGHVGDLSPGLEGLGPGGSILVGGAAIAAEVEQVVDLIWSGEEAFGLAGRLEALHLSLSSSGSAGANSPLWLFKPSCLRADRGHHLTLAAP